MGVDLALAIGVTEAKPLDYLGGAANGAHAFYEWASTVGYQSRLLTDETEPVTIPRLRSELETMLSSATGPIHRMVIYFAGHGIIREAEEGLWLLSDWYTEQRAVAVEVLKRRLYRYGIQQIAIFADCCRSLPPDMHAADLTPDGVLGRGPHSPHVPAIDKFVAAQDGTATFMVPGESPDKDRCLFSGVLMEGLWGKTEALSKVVRNKVTSRSLGTYLQTEAPRRAKVYKRELLPQVIPSFPEEDDIYFPSGAGTPPKAPPFPEWPPPEKVVGMGMREKLRGARVTRVQRDEAFDLLFDDVLFERADPPLQQMRSSRLIQKIRNQKRPQHFETGAGFVVDGRTVKSLWTTPDVFAERHGRPNWWRLNNKHNPLLLRSAPVLIEFEDGLIAAVTAIPRFIATILRERRGISALIYRHIDTPLETAAAAEKALAEMESGALRANDATDLATALRRGKHNDPMLGVLSAYLYDSIGDVDNIRRMAFFYAQFNQEIPYDIALLAQLPCVLRGGSLRAHVPPVHAREARTQSEQSYDWTHSATLPREGKVGGRWPWMRQGWAFLEDAVENDSALVPPKLVDISQHLAPSRFTLIDQVGARKLAEIFNLARPDTSLTPTYATA